MQIGQLQYSDITPHNELSKYFTYCQDSGQILAKTYLEIKILALRYIISDVAMDFIQ